jgi:hypothetical protein
LYELTSVGILFLALYLRCKGSGKIIKVAVILFKKEKYTKPLYEIYDIHV